MSRRENSLPRISITSWSFRPQVDERIDRKVCIGVLGSRDFMSAEL